MRPYQPAAAALALAALLPLAGAADAAVPAAGTATSTATLATLTAVGKKIDLATITATADSVNGLLAKVSVAPLQVDDADVVPAVTVEPDSSPVTVPGVSTPAALAPALAVTSPSLQLNAASGTAGQTSGLSTPDGLGSLSVLGLDLSIDGTLSVGSLVNATKADSGKTLEISDVALPSVADILAALGLDLQKLPIGTLQDLVTELDLALDAAQQALFTALNDAQTVIAAAPDEIATLTASLPGLQAAATAAQTEATNAVAAFTTALGADAAASLLFTDRAAFNAAPDAVTAPFAALVALADEANDANAAATAAAAAVTTANETIDDLEAALAAATAELAGLVDQVTDMVAAVLSDTPLVSLGSATVGTLARVDTTKTAQVVGEVTGLEVLGTDVIDLATGSSTLDLAQTASDLLGQVNSEISGVLGTLSSVLEGVAGITFPAPTVSVLEKTTSTGVDGAFGIADATVSVLDITIPAIQLPENVVLDTVLNALPADLAENLSLVDDVLSATGFGLNVGTLTEAARFRPSALTPVTNPPAPNPGSLPATGAPIGLAILAAAGVAGAAILRRSAVATARTEK